MTMNYSPRKMLVTGGAGFIGSHFILYMLEKHTELEIINLDLLTYAGSLDNVADITADKRYHFVEGDICDANLVKQMLVEFNIDTIVHFAAESHVDRSISGPAQFIQTNIVGTFTLLEAARQYWLEENKWDQQQCRFHHISTDEVYGSLEKTDSAFTESSAYLPNSPYSASKASSDHLVRAYQHTYKLPVTMSNCSNNYGPFQHPEKLIPTIINACLQNKAIPVYGDGSNIRDWLFVKDHCAALDRIICQGLLGESYNVGGDQELANIELVKLICQMLDDIQPGSQPYATLIEFVTDRAGHDWRYAIDSNKLQTELDWTATTTLHDGLLETIKFYLKD